MLPSIAHCIQRAPWGDRLGGKAGRENDQAKDTLWTRIENIGEATEVVPAQQRLSTRTKDRSAVKREIFHRMSSF